MRRYGSQNGRASVAQAIIVAAVLAGTCGCSDGAGGRTAAASTEPLMGESLGLVDLDGREFKSWRDVASQATVVVFTRSDCPVSNRHAPDIRQLYERFHPQSVEFYLIYVDPQESAESIRKHLLEYGYPCRALRDPAHAFAAYCGATTTPEAVVFDRRGKSVYRGRINDLYSDLGKARAAPLHHDLADAIEATLAGRTVATPLTRAVGCPLADLK